MFLALLIAFGPFAEGPPPAQLTAGPNAAVCYQGTIGTGARLRRVILERTLDSAVLHLYSRPPRQVALSPSGPPAEGRQFLQSSDGTSRVTITPSRASLTSMTSRDTTQAELEAAPKARDASSVFGEWVTAIGPGGVIRLVMRLTSGPCGYIVGAFDSPDQGQKDLPITSARIAGDSAVIEAAYMGLRIALPLGSSDARPGVLIQNGVTYQVTFQRGRSAELDRPQEPKRPFPYGEHEVRFASRSPGVRLAGTLTIPAGAGPHPAIVLISGSGAQDRDETIAGHRPFLVIADHLTRRGYAVLRTDDRGVAGTTGTPMQIGLDDVAEDVRGAIVFLRSRPDIDHSRIGLLGHSEGAYVAPIVAASDSSIAFLMLLGGPAASGRDVLTAQRTKLARATGDAEARVRVDSLLIASVFSVIDRRPEDHRLAALVDSAFAVRLATFSESDRRIAERQFADRTAAQDTASLALWKSRWFKSLYHHDPAPFLLRVRAPIFALIGSLDLQVPVDQNVARFEALFAGPRRSQLTLDRMSGINHMLQRAKTGRMEEYMAITETIAPNVLESMDRWLARVVPVAPKPR
jgi:dienelactone hydrolase